MAPPLLPTSSSSKTGRAGSLYSFEDSYSRGGGGNGVEAYSLPKGERGLPLVLRRLGKFKSMVCPLFSFHLNASGQGRRGVKYKRRVGTQQGEGRYTKSEGHVMWLGEGGRGADWQDFELAFWQLTYLIVSPRRVYKQTYHQYVPFLPSSYLPTLSNFSSSGLPSLFQRHRGTYESSWWIVNKLKMFGLGMSKFPLRHIARGEGWC